MDGTTGVGAVDAAAVWATAVAALLGLGTIGWRLARRVRRVAHRIEEFVDDWQGTPGRPGVEPRPGVMQRLAAIERVVEEVVHEVRPNGGASLRDAIHRVDRRTASIVGDDPPDPGQHP